MPNEQQTEKAPEMMSLVLPERQMKLLYVMVSLSMTEFSADDEALTSILLRLTLTLYMSSMDKSELEGFQESIRAFGKELVRHKLAAQRETLDDYPICDNCGERHG